MSSLLGLAPFAVFFVVRDWLPRGGNPFLTVASPGWSYAVFTLGQSRSSARRDLA